MIYKGLLFLLWFCVWLLLQWPPSVQYMVTGAFVSLLVSFFTADIFSSLYTKEEAPPAKGGGILSFFSRIFWFLCYVAVFLWECLMANIDVAWRVLHPGLPIRPGTLRLRTKLKSDIGLTFLANSITLTPGTTTIDIDKANGYIYVHVLALKEGCEKPEARQCLADRFERILERIFE
ncbi:MAG: Na+/H+ antiporter subunit E [Candidatus Omnitrophica bacterium]|nr:Na+/H+ antiporter subunit E [Candidatus Omnitrophota bacterium]MDD5436438.1 Na+/H+ antiporter subunit E [Candidatus Omnitrophota bacterium]